MAKTEKEIVQFFNNHLKKLKEQKSNYDNVNQTIGELVRQNSSDFNREVTPGERLDEEIFDTTATRASHTLASILQSRLTTPGEKWAIFSHPDLEIMKNEDAKRFYEKLSDEVYNITKDTNSQFYQKNHEFFLDLPVFGTGAMFILEDKDDNIIFDNRKLQEIYCDENNAGVIDTLYREFRFTARQAAQEFGEDNLGKSVKNNLMKDPSHKSKYIHAIIPKNDYERIIGEVQDKQAKYISIYISEVDNKIVKEGFFNEKPFVVSRWTKRIGEIYGIGAAWEVLSDIEVLNILSMLELEASELSIRPPLLATDEGVIGEPEWVPGGITYGAVTEDGQRLLQEFITGFDISKGLLAKQERIKNIEAAFFVDQFRDREGVQPLTATEALQNEEKRLALLSPQIKRIEDEYLSPMLERVVSIILRQKRIDVPDVLNEEGSLEFEIEYISPLSFTRRTSELTRYSRFLQNVAPFLQVHPEGLDNFELDTMEREIAEKSGIPLDQIRREEDVLGMRTQRAQQEQLQQELLNLESGANAAEKLSRIDR